MKVAIKSTHEMLRDNALANINDDRAVHAFLDSLFFIKKTQWSKANPARNRKAKHVEITSAEFKEMCLQLTDDNIPVWSLLGKKSGQFSIRVRTDIASINTVSLFENTKGLNKVSDRYSHPDAVLSNIISPGRLNMSVKKSMPMFNDDVVESFKTMFEDDAENLSNKDVAELISALSKMIK